MLDPFPTAPAVRTLIGRLLHSISWEYKQLHYYREGGRGRENVLTTEVLQALDLLPREPFLAEVIRRCSGGAQATRARLAGEIEDARLLILPGTTYLRPSLESHSASIGVQPDALLESPSTYTFVEAKRARPPGKFQLEQLPREYLTVLRDACPRQPLLLLVLPEPPPVLIEGQGRKGVREAIVDTLGMVLPRTEGITADLEGLQRQIEETVAWFTWPEIRQVLVEQVAALQCQPATVHRAVQRLASAAVEMIDWHTSGGS